MTLLDDREFPLVRLNFGEVGDDEFIAAVEATSAVFARGRPVVFVIDLTHLSGAVTVERRTRIAELMKTIQRDADRLMRGAIYIAPGRIARGVITALNWARGARPYPIRVVATEAEALEKARELL